MEGNTKHEECSYRETLYLESRNGPGHMTLPSLIAIFIQQYCRYRDIDIILVCESEPNGEETSPSAAPCHNRTPLASSELPSYLHLGSDPEQNKEDEKPQTCNNSEGHTILDKDERQDPLQIPSNLEYREMKHACLPRVVQDCQLPCILLPGRQFCVSGLANVMRHIIQAAVPLEPHRNLVTLLGFRQTCLKCCSEMSIWTKLCEVDTPQQITDFLRNPSVAPFPPSCLSKFQELLSQPVSTFNSEKRRRKLLKSKRRTEGIKQSGDGANLEKKDGGDMRPDVVNGEVGTVMECGRESNKIQNAGSSSVSPPEEGAINGGEEVLTSELSSKLWLCNKKEDRRKKRGERIGVVSVQGSLDNETPIERNGGQNSSDLNENGSVSIKEDVKSDTLAQSETGSQRSRRKPRNRKKIHKDELPELTHLFAQGIDVTLVDFALFVPIHLWLHTSNLNGTTQHTCRTVPLVLEWYKRMWDVPCVRQVASACLSLREVDVTHLKPDDSNDVGLGENYISESHFSEEDVRPHVGNLNVSRAVMRELLKKVLPGVVTRFEEEGLGGGFMAHPSKDTTLNWRNMAPAVSPIEGEVEARRARGKEQQIESIVTAVQQIATPGTRILDFCSGGGHLGIALAYYLPDSHVIMIENKEESLRRALGRIQTLGLHNVTLYLSNIDYFYGHFDIGVSLHACGVATDIVLSKCMERRASFVSSPCCYGSIHDTHHMTYPRSRTFRESSISKKDYFLVGHGAEQTCWNFESHLAKQGKQCMGFIDRDRAELAREQGYEVTLCSLQPETCSPKNNLLIGVSPDRQVTQT